MSLVLEALRRVEKSSGQPGSVGVAVTSYRPTPRPRGALVPLLLGLGTGIVLLILWRPQMPTAAPSPAGIRPEADVSGVPLEPQPSVPEARASAAAPATGPATTPSGTASPEPSVPAASSVPSASEPSGRDASSVPRAGAPPAPAPSVVRPALILQAISERDSQPVAVINDQLVREGDLFQGARILRIGPDSVTVRLENGEAAVVSFAPPPPPESSPNLESQ